MSAVDPVALLQGLIRCPSVTPADGGALAFIADRLAAAGFAADRVIFEAPGTPSVENLFARIGSKPPCLLFAGHTDVVPPGDISAWRFDPFSGTVTDGKVYGRGACDMKGGLAAALAAALTFVQAGKHGRGSIAFLITGDEEGPAINGTAKLLAWAQARGERFDQCILGEPTNPEAIGDMIKIGRRGSLSGSVTALGRQGHVAYPHLALNPIPVLMRLVEALIGTPLDESTEHFDASHCEVVSIDVGNPSTNVIPAQATAIFNIRFNDRWTPETLETELARRLGRVGQDDGFRLEVRPCNARAFLTAPNSFTDLLCDVIRGATGRQPILSTTGGTSDARFIVNACPVIEFGLVGRTMHAIDEHVAVADLHSLTTIYGRVLDRFLNTAATGSQD